MTLASIRPVGIRSAGIRPAARPQTDWSLDLPLPQPTRPAPRPSAPVPANTNVARLNGENIRYAGAGNRWGVDMAYLQADLIDLTPQDPLSIWEFGTYKIRVKAGLIDLKKAQLDAMIADQLAQQGPNFPLSNGSVEFKRGDQVKVKGTAKWKGIPVPLSVTARLSLASGTAIDAKPTSVRLFGIPVLWAAKLFNVDIAKRLPLPAGGPATMRPDYTVNVDLAKTGLFEGELKALRFRPDGLAVQIGGTPAPGLPRDRTGNAPNYAEVVAEGEVALESAIIRDAGVVIVDNTPEDPYSLNFWDTEGYARIERGDVILDEARLKKKFMGDTGAFTAKEAKLVGADMVVEGKYKFLGINWPVKFKLRFSTQNGQLKMTPHSVKFIGIGIGSGSLMDTLKGVAGARQDGDGVLLDLRQAASVEMGRIRELKTEPGRIVLVR